MKIRIKAWRCFVLHIGLGGPDQSQGSRTHQPQSSHAVTFVASLSEAGEQVEVVVRVQMHHHRTSRFFSHRKEPTAGAELAQAVLSWPYMTDLCPI